MADEFYFLTELFGLKVYDLKGQSLGRVKDAAIVPLLDPAAAGAHSAAFDPLGVLQYSGARSAAASALEYFEPFAGEYASGRSGGYRGGAGSGGCLLYTSDAADDL